MAIAKFVVEALSEGAFIAMINKALGFAKGIFTSTVGTVAKEELQKIINSKTWEDEHYFARDLVEAGLIPEKLKMMREGIKKAEEFDKLNGTHSARNFRIIVTYCDKQTTTGQRPGIQIIHRIALACQNSDEVFAAIEAVGAMHDPLFTTQKFLELARNHMWPYLQAKYEGAYNSANAGLAMLEAKVQREKAELNRQITFNLQGIKNLFAIIFTN